MRASSHAKANFSIYLSEFYPLPKKRGAIDFRRVVDKARRQKMSPVFWFKNL
jgi:hypothetical protein